MGAALKGNKPGRDLSLTIGTEPVASENKGFSDETLKKARKIIEANLKLLEESRRRYNGALGNL